jgi:hypothetical protein
VKVQTVVEAALGELHEVAGGDGHLVGEELDLHIAERSAEGCGRVCHGPRRLGGEGEAVKPPQCPLMTFGGVKLRVREKQEGWKLGR